MPRTVPLLLLLLLLLQVPASAGQWQRYDNVQFMPDLEYDGDSYHLRVRSTPTARPYTYIFRLYGADCPETDTRFPERIEEQAEAFRCAPATVLQWGEEAKKQVAKLLGQARRIEVETRKTKARGRSEQNRYYARITVDDTDLAEWLLARGLARAYGYHEDFPESRDTAERYQRRLEGAEKNARTAGLGIWGISPP